MIFEMSDSELMELGMDIEANAEDWLTDLMPRVYDRIPDELMWGIMYGFY